jgi:calcineurin-like phosphoesterase
VGESIICPTLYIPNASVKVEVISLVGVRLDVKSGAENVNFDVKAKLEERERKSQMVILDFKLFDN